MLGGAKPDFNLALAVMQNIRLQGVRVESRDPFERMLAAITAHNLRPVVDQVFPLSEIRTAIEHLGAGRHTGKVCISI